MNILSTIGSLTWNRPQSNGKLGTLFGVFLPGLACMFSMIIYLRLGSIIGSVGIYKALTIIGISCLIAFITSLSISSTATNMRVEAGGSYFMISRCFGLEIGSAIGIPFYLGQAIILSASVLGFSESFHDLFPMIPFQMISLGTLCLLTVIALVSVHIALKFQQVILLIILISFASFFAGGDLSGHVPTSSNISSLSFWAAFAIFFPAATGIEAGVSLSGNLKNPSRSLPLGSIAVVLVGTLVYFLIALFLWEYVPQEILASDHMIFKHIAKYESLIVMGIWAATLSTVLNGLITAPRTLQAIANDGILPKFIGKGFGKGGEPRVATLFTVILSFICIYFGQLDQVLSISSLFLLIAYFMLNLAAGLEDMLQNPSWRPTFRVPWPISIAGSLLCLFGMLMIDPAASFISVFLILLVYIFAKRRNIGNSLEDIREGVLMFFSRIAIYHLASEKRSSRSWRPHMLVFTNHPSKLSNLLSITSSITRDRGFLTLVPLISHETQPGKMEKIIGDFLKKNRIEALVEMGSDNDPIALIKKLLLNYGFGPLIPNTIALEICHNKNEYKRYAELIVQANATGRNLILINEMSFPQVPSKGAIEIWWDDEHRANSDLMIVLAYMLQKNSPWKGRKICVKSVVSTELARKKREEYFTQFFKEGRLNIDVEVLVVPDQEISLNKLAEQFSRQPSLLLFGMPPQQAKEDFASFEKRYLNLISSSKNLPCHMFVINGGEVELKKLFC